MEIEIRELVKKLSSARKLDKSKAERIKTEWAKRYNRTIPLSSEILAASSPAEKKKIVRALVTKPTRTMSGVSVIAVMTKPAPCPGKCIYCPTSKIAPKSYTGHEPSAMRALRNEFDPYRIVQNRLKQLHNVGHTTNKNEVIIQGGTFTALPWNYQYQFVKGIFDALNQFECCTRENPCKKHKARDLKTSQKINEAADNRVVSLIVETRPDFCTKKHIQQMLMLGATRVELGLQSVYDDILKGVKRGHDVEAAKKAIKDLKNAGFKVDLHVMLGLPGSTKKKDIEMFRILFSDEGLKPDGLKIYPCAVLKGAKLHDIWKAGNYKPVNDRYIMDVLKEAKTSYIPEYVRIKRIMRDIPSNLVEAGYKSLNLRQMLFNEMQKEGKTCRCIRCREIGHRYKNEGKLPKNVELLTFKYPASCGTEYFISFEDKKQGILLGFARLRIANGKAFLRELHVYGLAAPLTKIKSFALVVQHKGLGKKLLAEAEKIAKKNGIKELLVLSGAGVKKYYEMTGYLRKGYYMAKSL
ncbi:MAG: tRNA uridine(34) 5-carboxymethylaminomethyl modification radical SAM/GNAT enzyme Elp3 [archaeon]